MTNLIGKSTHPVQIKKIAVRIWALRDEIEAAIAERLKEEEHSEDNPADISDIKDYYHKVINGTASDPSEDEDETDENLDPSGNPMDDDAAAMLAAMGGGEEGAEDSESEGSENEDADAEKTEEDDDSEAADEETDDLDNSDEDTDEDKETEEAKDGEEISEEDEEAASLAAEMLADQGGDAEASDDEAEKPAKKERGPFERVVPDESKMAKGYVLLADVFMDQILLFCNKKFTIGQNLVIEFMVTEPFTVSAELVVCQDIGRNSKVIREVKYGNRLQCIFLFQFPGERSSLREFLKSVEPEIPPPPKKVKKSDESGDDDFDDLGF